MKKILVFVLVIIVAIVMTACGENTACTTSDDSFKLITTEEIETEEITTETIYTENIITENIITEQTWDDV